MTTIGGKYMESVLFKVAIAHRMNKPGYATKSFIDALQSVCSFYNKHPEELEYDMKNGLRYLP